MRRRGVDDAAPLARLHAGHRGADGVERRRQVDGDDRVPLLDREFLDRRDVLDAGIVDQDVARAELLFGRLDHRGDLGRLGHVGRRIERLDAELLLDAGALLLDLGRSAEAVDHDVGAVLGERAGDAEPDAGGGAGDDGVFPLSMVISLRLENWRTAAAIADRAADGNVKVAIVLLHCNIKLTAARHFSAIRPRRATIGPHATHIRDHVATGLPRPRPRSRPLHRRRAGARRGAVRAARAAADADPPPGAGGAAREPQAARRLRDHGPRRRRAARGRRRSRSIARSISCATTASCIASRAATPSSPASTITRTGDLVVFLICEHCGAVGEAAVRGGRRSAQGRRARRRLHAEGAGDRDRRRLRALPRSSESCACMSARQSPCAVRTRVRSTPPACALVVLLCLTWGFNQVAVKLALPDIPPLIQCAIRSALATLIVLGLDAAARPAGHGARRHARRRASSPARCSASNSC